MKDAILKIIRRYYPELESNRLFPAAGIVTAIPDPPNQEDTTCTPQRPRYAVNIKLLTPKFEFDESMPELLDVPVSLGAAGYQRGNTGLPQKDTMVLVSFIGGSLSKPVVTDVLPHFMTLPKTTEKSMRWQQDKDNFQEIDDAGNWKRKASGSISDQAQTEINSIAPKIWIGNNIDNALVIDSSFMEAIIAALDTLSSHTHPTVGEIAEGSAVTTQKEAIQALKTKLDAFAKT